MPGRWGGAFTRRDVAAPDLLIVMPESGLLVHESPTALLHLTCLDSSDHGKLENRLSTVVRAAPLVAAGEAAAAAARKATQAAPSPGPPRSARQPRCAVLGRAANVAAKSTKRTPEHAKKAQLPSAGPTPVRAASANTSPWMAR